MTTVSLEQAPPIAAAENADKTTGATENLPPGLLTGRQKLVLQLLFDREMSPSEISKVLGISAQAVRSTKHKAIQKLREYFPARDSS